MKEFTGWLRAGRDLDPAACEAAARLLPRPDIAAADKQAFLEALHAKGESVAEVAAFARVFRGLALDPQLGDLASEAIDIVGTGGSGSKGYNISSVTALLVAASGSRVLKHGNRAITSQSGSADFLAQLGVRMDAEPELLRRAVRELNFCFFFAPAFHPAFKEIMPVRKAMAEAGKRSIFNILGPLINPARPGHQLLGVMAPHWVQPLAAVLDDLGLRAGMVVCCELQDGGNMDEFTTAGRNAVQGIGCLRAFSGQWLAGELGFAQSPVSELRGGTAADNIALFHALLDGRGPHGLAESILLNAAAALRILGRVDDLTEGRQLAREILLGGALRDWLARARDFYAEAV